MSRVLNKRPCRHRPAHRCDFTVEPCPRRAADMPPAQSRTPLRGWRDLKSLATRRSRPWVVHARPQTGKNSEPRDREWTLPHDLAGLKAALINARIDRWSLVWRLSATCIVIVCPVLTPWSWLRISYSKSQRFCQPRSTFDNVFFIPTKLFVT